MKSNNEYQEPCMAVLYLYGEDVVTSSGETGVPWQPGWSDALEKFN